MKGINILAVEWTQIKQKIWSSSENIIFSVILIFALIYFYIFLAKDYVVLKYKKIKKSISCYSIHYFFYGEEIVFHNVIVVSVFEQKRLELPEEGLSACQPYDIVDHFIEIVGQPENCCIFVPPKKNFFFPGMKTSICCKRYWYDKKVVYFEKFV